MRVSVVVAASSLLVLAGSAFWVWNQKRIKKKSKSEATRQRKITIVLSKEETGFAEQLARVLEGFRWKWATQLAIVHDLKLGSHASNDDKNVFIFILSTLKEDAFLLERASKPVPDGADCSFAVIGVGGAEGGAAETLQQMLSSKMTCALKLSVFNPSETNVHAFAKQWHKSFLKRGVFGRKRRESGRPKGKPVPLSDIEDSGATCSSRSMITASVHESMLKQGYRVVGTHSAVKLCRWTKHHLKGHGACYKHTCYGLDSLQCMEATSCVACANKCVFCWRHNMNPLAKEWRWCTDPPKALVEQLLASHFKMVSSLHDMPDASPELLKSAAVVRHCALSLIGEPILYPHINEFLNLLHERQISTFLVTNGQYPDRIQHLKVPVTQLYLSVDAATPESLQAVDRPIFPDAWKRMMESIDSVNPSSPTGARLKTMGIRTVFRLTLLKGWNEADVPQYAALVVRGLPDFVEVKAATYAGDKQGVNLTLKNIPWHVEVKSFAEALTQEVNLLSGGGYGIASEHSHGCCVLMARKEPFLQKGRWHTWIDFDGFFALQRRWKEAGEGFTAGQYCLPTPPWALYGASEGGFDPSQSRQKR